MAKNGSVCGVAGRPRSLSLAPAAIHAASLASGKPVAFGILTVRDETHAVARSQPGPGNKGAEAAAAAVETAILMRELGE